MRLSPHFMPALITPFDDVGNIIFEAHAHNLRVQTERGVGGFVLGGSTGEGPYLEKGERALLLAEARVELGDEPYLVSGVAAQSVRQANSQVEEGATGGADAALVLTPTSLARGNHSAVMRFYSAVAEAAGLSSCVLGERAPLSAPDERWDRLLYPISQVEEFLRARAGGWA